MLTRPYGIIFDMDGVLVDSEPFIIAAATQMFAEHSVAVKPEDFHPFTGTGENRFLGGVAEKYGFPIDLDRDKKRTYDIYLEIIKGQLTPLAGVRDFIARCRKLGKNLAVASSADWRKVKGNLFEIGLPPETFDVVVAGEDVIHKKPAPDIFLLAARKLGLNAADCLIIEDALSGVQAARAAGGKCLAITSSFTPDRLPGADFYAPDLAHAPEEASHWSD